MEKRFPNSDPTTSTLEVPHARFRKHQRATRFGRFRSPRRSSSVISQIARTFNPSAAQRKTKKFVQEQLFLSPGLVQCPVNPTKDAASSRKSLRISETELEAGAG